MKAGDKELDLNAVWRVIEKFKDSVLRLGINLYDHFERFDKTGEQLISEYFFRKVLEVCLRNEVPLSDDEIRILVSYFQYRDGRVMYTELCDRVHDKCMDLSTDIRDNLMTGLEWEDPMHVNALNPEEASHLMTLLNKMASILIRKDHPIDVHFKEYEQIARNPGCVSLTHLARILKFMSLNLCQKDFNLLVKRYSRHSFLFNFIPFLDELNSAIKCLMRSGITMDVNMRYVVNADPEKIRRPDLNYPKGEDRGKELGLPVSFRLLTAYAQTEEGPLLTIRRIKHHIFTNGIDLTPIFKDLDRRNSGIISGFNFKRALTNSGINSGVNCKLVIRPDDIDSLIAIYQKPNGKDSIMWRLFVNDISACFLKHELNTKDHDEDSDLRFIPSQGSVWEITTEEERILCEESLCKLRSLLKARRWTLKPFFEEWDPSNSGHVNLMHFRNILSSNGLIKCPKELNALEKRYVDFKGFDYLKFRDELRQDLFPDDDQSESKMSKSKSSPSTIFVDPCAKKEYTPKQASDALRRIRKQIIVNSQRLDDYFKQFDPINKFTVSDNEFLRVLGSTKIDFTIDEGKMLTEMFKAPLQDGRVEYKRFLDVIEEAYTQKNLDKAPLLIPVKHVPVTDDPDRFLNMNERRAVESALDKLSNKLSMVNYDDVRCFDHAKAGDLSRNQLMQCLDSVRVRLTSSEIDSITKAFGRKIGGNQYIEYLPLLNAVDILYKDKRS